MKTSNRDHQFSEIQLSAASIAVEGRSIASNPVPHQKMPGKILTVCLVLTVCAITALAYRSIIFNSFLGDDFVALVWLKDAVHNTQLIVRNFEGPWLQCINTKFYRPVQAFFWLTDYFISPTDATLFHITNLTHLLIASASLFFIVRELQLAITSNINGQSRLIVPFAAALLFGLYPLHPETVSFITGRVDTIAAMFMFGSIWCYMRWRRTNGLASCLAAASFMTLGFLSKESTIVTPAVFVCYELFVKLEPQSLSRLSSVWSAFKPTMPFWALLIPYFVARRLALGTFVGGYDDSISPVSKELFFTWLHSLRITLWPINRSIMSDISILSLGWLACMIAACALVTYFLVKERNYRRYFLFSVSWFLISLAPVYKLFAIRNDLQCSRFAFLATAPLCMIIALAFADTGNQNAVGMRLRRGLLFAFASLAFLILGVNNQPWVEAGNTSNAIRTALTRFYSGITDDPQVLLVGLPDQIHGAYLCRNALDGMTKTPQFPRDIHNCLMVNGFDRILPLGFLKESLWENRDKVIIAQWDPSDHLFRNVTRSAASSEIDWNPNEFSHICRPDNVNTQCTLSPLDKHSTYQTVNITASGKGKVCPGIELDAGRIQCFGFDFIDLTVQVERNSSTKKRMSADLMFVNNLSPESDFKDSCSAHATLYDTADKQDLLFALRGLPDWSMGGECRRLKIKFPEGTFTRISKMRLIPATGMMPRINFDNSGYLGTKGFMHLGLQQHSGTVTYDARKVPGARGIIFEITRPNVSFESPNASTPNAVLLKEIRCNSPCGTLRIDHNIFPGPALYQGRAWAVDESGRRIGVAGDHIIFAIDS